MRHLPYQHTFSVIEYPKMHTLMGLYLEPVI